MPTLTRWMIRSSFAWLAIGMVIQAASPFSSALPAPRLLAGLRAFELHALTVGWLTQLIFGVVFWMFPKASLEKPRGSEHLGWATYGCLNFGLVLRLVGEPLAAAGLTASAAWALPASAVLQWLAALAFVGNTWARVKER